VLGVAIGASSYDAGDNVRAFGVGAGWWAAVSALIDFFVGGFMSARTAAVPGRSEGLLQGSMVWVVAIPLLMYLVSAMISSAVRTTGAVANTAAQTSAAAANTSAGERMANQAEQVANNVGNQVQQGAESVRQSVNPQNAERAADATGRSAL